MGRQLESRPDPARLKASQGVVESGLDLAAGSRDLICVGRIGVACPPGGAIGFPC